MNAQQILVGLPQNPGVQFLRDKSVVTTSKRCWVVGIAALQGKTIRMKSNPLQGTNGDCINALLVGCGSNLS